MFAFLSEESCYTSITGGAGSYTVIAIVVLVCRTAGMISSFDLSAVTKVRGIMDTGCLSLLQHGAVM